MCQLIDSGECEPLSPRDCEGCADNPRDRRPGHDQYGNCLASDCDVCDQFDGYSCAAEVDDDTFWGYSEPEFANPGGNSALRASGPGNPRNLPCPTCGTPNVLTPADKARHYQCDTCADRAESGWGY